PINMFDSLRHGEKIIIAKLYSLAESTRHLGERLQKIEEKGACIPSLNAGLQTSNRSGPQFVYIVQYLVKSQRNEVREKTTKRLRNAHKKGVTTGRPRKADENVQRAIIMYESKKYSLAEIRSETGISKSTLYR